jgi:hypothetical protein
MARFAEPSVLADTGNTKADLKAYVEGLIPQADIINTAKGTNVDSNKIVLANGVPYWREYTLEYTDFATASTTSADYSVVSLGAGSVIHAIKLVTTTAYAGGSVSDVKMDVGLTSGTPTEYLSGEDVDVLDTTAASGEYSTVDFLTENASTSVLARIVCTAGNCDTLTAGVAKLYIMYSIADAGL